MYAFKRDAAAQLRDFAPGAIRFGHGEATGRLQVAILGGGPAGSTLAALLGDEGFDVVLFDDAKRPELVVGESLIPAMVPIFRRLGIEERVAAMGVAKPGVSFLRAGHVEPVHLSFRMVGKRLPQYAYNVPRPAFDDLLRQRVREAGVVVVADKAKVERDPQREDAVKLADQTTTQVPRWRGRQPDLIVDATGRRRTIARLLDLPSRDGNRADVAHFAHFENFSMHGLEPGQVITAILKTGWAWCIPLPDKVSVGIVAAGQQLKKYGSSPEQQLLAGLKEDPHLGPRLKDATRVSDVVSYTNYQKISRRGHGGNWVLMGDALGFVDPMLSPGLFLAMRSAELLTDELKKHCPPRHPRKSDRKVRGPSEGASPHAPSGFHRALRRYDREMHGWFNAWWDLIEFVYTGELLAMREAGVELTRMHPNRLSKWFNHHMAQQMASMAAGKTTRSRYTWSLLRCGTRFGMRDKDPGEYRVM